MHFQARLVLCCNFLSLLFFTLHNVVECMYIADAPCTFSLEHDGETLYFDLSMLYRSSDPWIAGDVGKTAYFSICGQPVFRKDFCRDESAAVCIKEEKAIFNAGKLKTRRVTYEKEKDEEMLIVEFEGSKCNEVNSYESIFHIICSEYESEPILQTLDCKYLFRWETKSGCQVINEENEAIDEETLKAGDECIFTVLGYRIDLNPLNHYDNYRVESKTGRSFEMNICGSVSDSACSGPDVAICEIKENSKPEVRAINKLEILLNSDRKLLLMYKNENDRKGAEILLECGKKQQNGIEFLTEENNHLYFKMKTSLACLNHAVLCSFSDGRNDFPSLISLNKQNDNWKVNVPGKDTTYYFNVCGPINNVSDTHYFDGKAKACLLNNKSKTVIILGTVQQQPSIKDLKILFTNGSICINSPNKIQRHSLEIQMECSEEVGNPEYVSSSECHHKLHWKTPAACPIKVITGKNCVIRGELYEYQYNFDFNKLRNNKSDFEIKIPETNESFSLNICEPLVGTCGHHTNSGICLHHNGTAKVIGEPLMNPIFKNGIVKFEANGLHSCRTKGRKSKSIIMMLCDYNKTNEIQSGPELVLKDYDLCLFQMVWHTVEACTAPKSDVACTLQQDGKVYDLSSLTQVRDNYIIPFNLMDITGQFVINICQPVIGSEGILCGKTDSVCMVNLSEQRPDKRYTSLGTIKKMSLSMKNDVLTLSYGWGSACMHGDSGYISTTIEFHCDSNSQTGLPEFLGEKNCTYNFLWKTKLACNSSAYLETKDSKEIISYPETVIVNKTAENHVPSEESNQNKKSENNTLSHTTDNKQTFYLADNVSVSDISSDIETQIQSFDDLPLQSKYDLSDSCTAVNPTTGYRFDLSSLTGKNWYVEDEKGRDIVIAVCGAVKSAENKNNSSGSFINGKMGGIASNKVKFSNGILSLTYENGDDCVNDELGQNVYSKSVTLQKHYSTFIEFVCSPTNEGPLLRKGTGTCDLQVLWSNEFACERKISCSFNVEKRDLHMELLVGLFRNYRIKNGNDEFLINVCQPLLNEENLKYPSNSNSYMISSHQNLGKNLEIPKITTGDSLILRYKDGSTCLTNSLINYSSTINFICDKRAGKGMPTFKSYAQDTCEYKFEWKTDVTCSDNLRSTFIENCIVKDVNRNAQIDLSQFYKNEVSSNSNHTLYRIQLCENMFEGKEHKIVKRSYKMWLSYKFTQVTVDYQQNTTILYYLADDKRNFSLFLLLKCSKKSGMGTPVIRVDGHTTVVIEWISQAACYKPSNDYLISENLIPRKTSPIFSWQLFGVGIVGVSCITLLFFANIRKSVWQRFFQLRRRRSGSQSRVRFGRERSELEEINLFDVRNVPSSAL